MIRRGNSVYVGMPLFLLIIIIATTGSIATSSEDIGINGTWNILEPHERVHIDNDSRIAENGTKVNIYFESLNRDRYIVIQGKSYKKKSKLAAFILSIVFGYLGVDWFYLSVGQAGYIFAGVIKVIMNIVCIFCCCPCGVIWYFVDIIRILADLFPDGNNVPLFDDM